MGKRAVAKASGSFGSLMFFMGHFASHSAAVTIGFFIVVVGGIAGEVGVGLSGHCDREEVFKRPGIMEVDEGSAGGRNRWVLTLTTVRRMMWQGPGGKLKAVLLFEIGRSHVEAGYLQNYCRKQRGASGDGVNNNIMGGCGNMER